MGQPIRLFGETDKQCKVRLRALELMNEESGVRLCLTGIIKKATHI
jgi:hypothetical protein